MGKKNQNIKKSNHLLKFSFQQIRNIFEHSIFSHKNTFIVWI